MTDNLTNSIIFLSIQILLVTSSRTPDRWIVPGGGLEPNELDEDAAIREVMEEAGVRGVLSRPLGAFEVNVNTDHKLRVVNRLMSSFLSLVGSRTTNESIGRRFMF